MPQQEVSHLRQTAVLWPWIGYDRFGLPQVGNPMEITLRWVDKQQIVQGPHGGPITVDATAVVAQDIHLDSLMWLGTISQLPPVDDVMLVKTFDKTADIKVRAHHRSVGMIRFMGELP